MSGLRPSDPPIAAGTILLERYRVERVLGQGGMGVVVAATHTRLEERVAIKILRPDVADDTAQARFVQEARALARVKSEFMPRINDVGVLDSGEPYMVMEYLEGEDLGQLLATRGPLPIALVAELIVQACVALTEAHTLGFVHRDIKASNLFVTTRSDGASVVKVLDFGISKSPTVEAGLLTTREALLGTPAYMAPEQWRSARDADARSDLWSLGVVMYELVVGRRPFPGGSLHELCAQILTEPPAPAPELGAIAPVVERCLAKEPADRYASAPELARALAPLAASADTAALVARMDRIASSSADRHKRASDPVISAAPTVRDPRSASGATVPTTGGRTPAVAVAASTSRSSRRTRIALGLAIGAAVAVAAGLLIVHGRFGHSSRSPGGARYGGTLHVVDGEDEGPPTIPLYTPAMSRRQWAMRVAIEPLIQLGPDLELRAPSLVTIDAPADRQQLVLHMRPGVYFHPHRCLPGGERAADGADVAFSIEEAAREGQLGLPIVGLDDFVQHRAPHIAGIEVRPDGVHVALTSPAPMYAFSLANVYLVPHELEGCEDLTAIVHPVGTGPFRFADDHALGKIVLVRNERYWRTGPGGDRLPYLDRVEISSEPDPEGTVRRMTSAGADTIDVAMPIERDWPVLFDVSASPPRVASRFPADTKIDVAAISGRGLLGIWGLFVTEKPGPLRDQRLRQAAALALDREADVAQSDPGNRAPVTAYGRFLTEHLLGFDRSLPALGHDPARAARMLANAGHPAGDGLPEIQLAYSHDERAAQAIVAQLAAIGIHAQAVPSSASDAASLFSGRAVDAVLVRMWTRVYGDEAYELATDFSQRVLSPKVDELARELPSADRLGREALYRQIEAALLDDLPVIPIALLRDDKPFSIRAVRRDVQGYIDRSTSSVVGDLAGVWLDRPR